MKTLLLVLGALLVGQALRLLNRTEWFPFEATSDNFGLRAEELLQELLK